MSSTVKPFPMNRFPNDCYHLFVEPFTQGAWNVRDAIGGNRVKTVAVDALGVPTIQKTAMSLSERVTALCLGILLLVPVVNAIAMLILNRAGSDYLYAPPALPPNPASSGGGSQPPVPPVPVIPLPGAADLILRKTEAKDRLDAIEAMGAAAIRNFALNPAIETFDLGAVLQKYPSSEPPSSLMNLVDWANVDGGQTEPFRQALDRYERARTPQERMVHTLMGHLKEYFNQKRAGVAVDSQEETDLKEKFRDVVEKTIDANRNCPDQMLSQMEGMMLDVIADGSAEAGPERILARLLYRASHELCKHRSILLKEICARQNPREVHMATLERVVKQRLAAILGMQGAIFETGAQYASMLRDYEGYTQESRAGRADRVERDIQNAVNTFLNEYRPLDYLANDLRGNIGIARRLRGDLSVWADHYYGISREDVDDPQTTVATVPATLNMNQRLAEDPADDYGSFTMGGNWNPAAALCLLEAANIIRRRDVPGGSSSGVASSSGAAP